MDRIAYAFHITPGSEDDLKAAAADMRSAGLEFGRTRQEQGLTALGVWLQVTPRGSLVVVLLEGDLESYFQVIRGDPGIDAWFRDKILEWTGSEEETSAVYAYPQSEELFHWSIDAGS